MKKYKYITIDQLNGETDEGRPVYRILNNRKGSELGTLFYYQAWHQYVFTQSQENIFFSVDCLRDIQDFIEREIPKKRNN